MNTSQCACLLYTSCAGLKAVTTGGKVGEYHGFTLSASYNLFANSFELTIKGKCSYKIEIGKDPLGNIQRIHNALSSIDKKLEMCIRDRHMSALYAGEIPIPEEVVDEILRTGSNKSKSQLRLIYNFMSEQSAEDYTEFVKREYGIGGKGLKINGNEYSVWFDETGMQIAVGHTVNDRLLDKAFLSWEDVSGRIHQLLKQGEYAPQSVLDAARENALSLIHI